MAWDDGLDGVAHSIACCESPRLRVMAGPGTGKSFAIKRRVARLIEECGVQPEEILAVTFTRVAAGDLKNDLLSLDVSGVERIRCGTLHSFCFSLLLSQDFFQYLDRNPRPLLAYEAHGVIRYELEPALHDLRRFGTTKEVTKLIKAYEAAWATLQIDMAGSPKSERERLFEVKIVEWLKFHKAILLGELIPITLKVLSHNPVLVETLGFRHVIVDEYQDLNKAEQELVHLLARRSYVSIVGDVDQSIYSFKYAHPEGILSFNDRYEDGHDETISECRRCPQRVVEMANCLIRHNYEENPPVRLECCEEKEDGYVRIVQWSTFEEEVQGIAKYVKSLLEKDYSADDILILSPRRRLAARLSDCLSTAGISSYSFFPENMYDDNDIKESLAMLSLFCDRSDDISLRYLLGCKSSNWNASGYSVFMEICDRDVAHYEVLKRMQETGFPRKMNKIMIKFREIHDNITALESMSMQEIVQHTLSECVDEDKSYSLIRSFADEIIEKNPDIKPYQFIKILRECLYNPEPQDCEGKVKIMSIHKSKGLSSRVVIMASCVDGVIPRERATFNDEQRRLFYVGITRAKEALVLSSFMSIQTALAHQVGIRVPKRNGGSARCHPSIFLSELGDAAPETITGTSWLTDDC